MSGCVGAQVYLYILTTLLVVPITIATRAGGAGGRITVRLCSIESVLGEMSGGSKGYSPTCATVLTGLTGVKCANIRTTGCGGKGFCSEAPQRFGGSIRSTKVGILSSRYAHKLSGRRLTSNSCSGSLR